MCVYSNVGDWHRHPDQWPWQPQRPTVPPDPTIPDDFKRIWDKHAKDAEVADLKRRVEQLEELLRKAKKYDEESGQPDCELESKKEVLRKLAKALGVEINLP